MGAWLFWSCFPRCKDISGASLMSQTVKLCLQCGRPGFYPWVRKIPWRRKWQPTPVFLSGESHAPRSLAATVRGVTESDTTEQLALPSTRVLVFDASVVLEHKEYVDTPIDT